MGVNLDLQLKDQTNPLVGGKAHVELPISTIWKLIEGENQLMKTLVIALEETTLGNLYDIQTVKADITYNAEKVLEGIYNMAIDCIILHKDGTEEKATMLLQGKKESGMVVTSLKVIAKKLEDASLLNFKFVAQTIQDTHNVGGTVTSGWDDTTKAAGHRVHDAKSGRVTCVTSVLGSDGQPKKAQTELQYWLSSQHQP